MPPLPPTSTGLARFNPGLALIRKFNPALRSTEFVLAGTVYRGLTDIEMALTEPGL